MNDVAKFVVVFAPILVFMYLFTVYTRTINLTIEIPLGFVALIFGYVIVFLLENRRSGT